MLFLAVFKLLSDRLTAIYVELHRCPSHHSILLTQGRIWEIFAKKFWELAILKNELFLSRPFWFFFSKKKKICFIPMKISPNLYGRMNGSKFWCFPWFPEISLLCVILRYTVYVNPNGYFLVDKNVYENSSPWVNFHSPILKFTFCHPRVRWGMGVI